jgi:hypothetical protein
VEYVNVSLETITNVNCEAFATMLGRHINRQTFFKDDRTFNVIDSTFYFFQPLKKEWIDVRFKVRLSKGDITKVVCMDKFGTFYDSTSQTFAENEPLKKVLLQVVEGKE